MQFLYSCATIEKISTDIESRGPSAIAELLVMLHFEKNRPWCFVFS